VKCLTSGLVHVSDNLLGAKIYNKSNCAELLLCIDDMAKTKEISAEKRASVICFHKEGFSVRQISKKTHLPPSTVGYIVKKFRDEGLVCQNRHRSGRPRCTSRREDRKIVREVKKKRRKTANKIAVELKEELSVSVSAQTVRNRIHEHGFYGRVLRKKPFVSAKNKRARIKFAKEHISKDMSFWRNILFSDESKFNFHGSDGRIFVWRKPNEEFAPECTKGTVKYGGGNVKVWGCFSYDGVGELVFIDEIMTGQIYKEILQANLFKSARKLFKRRKWIYQQDNDPKHTCRIVKEFFAQKKV
jgi:transposase